VKSIVLWNQSTSICTVDGYNIDQGLYLHILVVILLIILVIFYCYDWWLQHWSRSLFAYTSGHTCDYSSDFFIVTVDGYNIDQGLYLHILVVILVIILVIFYCWVCTQSPDVHDNYFNSSIGQGQFTLKWWIFTVHNLFLEHNNDTYLLHICTGVPWSRRRDDSCSPWDLFVSCSINIYLKHFSRIFSHTVCSKNNLLYFCECCNETKLAV
jgi:hypothetical protein